MRNPLTAPPLPGEKDTRVCRYCEKPGHVEKDCRKKKAEQLAKAGDRRQPARSLETSGNDWEESDGGGQDSMELYQPLRCALSRRGVQRDDPRAIPLDGPDLRACALEFQ